MELVRGEVIPKVQLLLNAAGGSVTTLDGNELGYGKADFLNPDFIARGRA